MLLRCINTACSYHIINAVEAHQHRMLRPSPPTHAYPLFPPSFPPQSNGRQIFSASDDCTVKIWDMRSPKCVATLSGHSSHVRCLATSSGGIVSAASAEMKGASAGSSDDTIVVSGSQDGVIRIWDQRFQKVRLEDPVRMVPSSRSSLAHDPPPFCAHDPPPFCAHDPLLLCSGLPGASMVILAL
jgi:hypothetical protein